jgi:hypothetical protein
VEFRERDELYGVRQLERRESYLGYAEYRCADDERDLHAQLFRHWRNNIANGNGSDCGSTDGDAHRISHQHRVR